VLGFVILRDAASASAKRHNNHYNLVRANENTLQSWTLTYFDVFIGAAAPQTRRADSHDVVSSGGQGPLWWKGVSKECGEAEKERNSRIKSKKMPVGSTPLQGRASAGES